MTSDAVSGGALPGGAVGWCIASVREAGALLMEHFSQTVECESKGDADIVTAADRRAEAFLVRKLRERFPSHDIVSEESPARRTGSDFVWYVDPLDGTKNFVRQSPAFSISMALAFREELAVAAVYCPGLDELFAAESGGGAFLNGRPIRVSRAPRVSDCLFATGFPSRKRHRGRDPLLYSSVAMATQGARRTGSSAMDLAWVACGRIDFLWDIGLSPWDMAAGTLLVDEAGGAVSDLCGKPFSIDVSPHVLADNGRVHDELIPLFAGLVR